MSLNIDEKKLIELLENKFPTKEDFEKFQSSMISFKHAMYFFKEDVYQYKQEFREFKMEIREDIKIINEKLDDLKPSAKSLDSILEQHPIPRIERLEKHANLSPFTPTLVDSE